MYHVLILSMTFCSEITCIMSFKPHNYVKGQSPHFVDEETKVQKGEVTCSRLYEDLSFLILITLNPLDKRFVDFMTHFEHPQLIWTQIL